LDYAAQGIMQANAEIAEKAYFAHLSPHLSLVLKTSK
jgi:hypothetical protein